MELEISTFKIKQGDVVVELTASEAKELHQKLNEHFGSYVNFSPRTFFNGNSDGNFSGATYTYTPAGGRAKP